MTSKKNLSNQLDASAAIVVANPDDRVLVHLQQTNELANELLGDIGRFRSIDQSNGRNSESVSTLDLALGKYFDQSRNLRSTILTSPEVYTNVKNLYMSLQDTKIYFGQAIKKPSTSAKDSFVDPFKVISVSVQGQVHTLLESITAELDAMNNPNPQISVEVYQLGISHMYGLDGRPVNYTVAAQYFEHAASNGNTEAMTLLSKCYLNGHGVEQNESKGMEWLVQAANSKVCPHAKNELAMLIIANLREGYPSCVIDYCASLLEGETHTSRRRFENQVAMNSNGGVGRGAGQASTAPAAAGPEGQGHGKGDYYGVEEAIKLLLDAASDGCVDAKSNLGSLYEEAGDLEQAASWYHQASDEGCARSTYLLGHLFMKGKLSASKAHTFALLQQAAKSGQMEAFYCLGTCYEQGIGAEVDIDLAVLHYRRGAKLGSKLGMYSLGYLLVQNAIEARRKLKQLRPYASDRSHAMTTNSVVVVESNPEDEQYAAMVEEAEGMLQEGIHWLRAASENHIKDAAFQLGRLYEQAIGVPNDSFAALSNYRWAAQLGHTRAAFFAGNLLFAHAQARGTTAAHSTAICEAAVYYHQAALGGITEAMNSYAILLEDGRASEVGMKNPHLAAAWFYQACVERECLEKAFLNLAMLIIATPLSSFRTIPGDIVTLPDLKDFLLDFFESDAFAHDARREAVLEMVDSIDEHNPNALPLVEEVSLSLSATRSAAAANRTSSSSSPGGRVAPPRPPRSSGTRANTSANATSNGNAPSSVTVESDDDDETIVVRRIPISHHQGGHGHTYSIHRVNRVHEEVHKLSRGPIQNQGFVGAHFARGGGRSSEETLVPPRSTSPPVHAQQHHRSGEMYSTDGPVIPPSFVPRAIQYNPPAFKPDKPQPHPKPDQVPASYLATAATAAIAAPPVPLLSSPTRKSHPTSAELQAQKPPPPPRTAKLIAAASPTMGSGGGGGAGDTAASSAAAHKPATAAPAPAPTSTVTAGTASSAAAAGRSGSAPPRERAKSATRRLSFISGFVKMLGAGGDKEEVVEEDEVQDAHAPTEEGKTSTVPFQQHPRGGAHSAGDMQTRKSMDSLPVKRSSSVWKSLKHAAHLGSSTSKSVDLSGSQANNPNTQQQQHQHQQQQQQKESSPGRFYARSATAPGGTFHAGDTSGGGGVGGGGASGGAGVGTSSSSSRHPVPNNYYSAGASTKRPGVGAGASSSAPQRAVSTNMHATSSGGGGANGGANDGGGSGGDGGRSMSPAQGLFASEPQPVPSPSKPAKPQYVPTANYYTNNNNNSNVSAGNQQTEHTMHRSAGAQQHQQQEENRTNEVSEALPMESPEDEHGGITALTAHGGGSAGSTNGSVGSKSRDSSPSKRNSILAKVLQVTHKKYLTRNDETANTVVASAAAAAATSTGTMESVEVEESEMPEAMGAGANSQNPGKGPSPAAPQLKSRTNTAQQNVLASVEQSEVTEFDEHELGHSNSTGDASGHEFYEPVSDLSISSRDIRY